MEKLTGKWLAAVSGGPDSMALTAMCLQEGIDIEAAHVNYHHRKEADEEEAYVRSFCMLHGIECHVLSVKEPEKGNFEAAARKIRYDFFAETAWKRNCRGVLVAHQEDDLIETYLMQEEKNLVPEYYGLKESVMYGSLLVKRPLLSHTKKELEEYCERNGIRYFVDQTNFSDEYTRNRIRHETVEKLNRFERDMILREIRQKNAVMQERRCRVGTMIRGDKVSLKQYRMLSEEDRFALLRMTADDPGNRISLSFIREIDDIICKKDDFVIRVKNRNIVQDKGYFFMADLPKEYCDVYESVSELTRQKRRYYRIEAGEPGVNAVTTEASDYPLKIRSFRPGDVIRMRYGRKQVARFFVDRHIPLYLRETWPVVENAQGNIILVPGLGCDVVHFSIKPDFNVIQCSLSDEGENEDYVGRKGHKEDSGQ